MAVPRLSERQIQQLFTDDRVVINNLNDKSQMLRIADALKSENVTVRHLLLDAANWNGQLSQRAAQALQDAFRVNATITKLDLFYNISHHLSILFEGVAASQSIRTLLVYNCDNISVQDIATLNDLDRLELYQSAFERCAFTGLMAALMPNGRLHGLQNLSLFSCGIDSAKVAEIAQMVRVNTSLKELTMNDTIENEGAVVLADALLDNNTVTNLDLQGCGIGDVGAIALAGLLKKNTAIESVNLRQNFAVTDEGKQALLNASLWNTSLEVLQIENGLGATDQQRMSRTLEINRFR
jgi:hypothetical protein